MKLRNTGKAAVLTCILFTITLILLPPAVTSEEVVIPGIPDSIEDFMELRNSTAVTPEGGAAMFVLALYLYSAEKDFGLDAVTVMLVNDDRHLKRGDSGYKGYSPVNPVRYLLNRVVVKPYIARSYFKGSVPENGYALPTGSPLKLSITRNKYSVISEREVKVFVYSSGAATPRPVKLKRNSAGIWKADEFSSLVVGVAPPVKEEKDDL